MPSLDIGACSGVIVIIVLGLSLQLRRHDGDASQIIKEGMLPSVANTSRKIGKQHLGVIGRLGIDTWRGPNYANKLTGSFVLCHFAHRAALRSINICIDY